MFLFTPFWFTPALTALPFQFCRIVSAEFLCCGGDRLHSRGSAFSRYVHYQSLFDNSHFRIAGNKASCALTIAGPQAVQLRMRRRLPGDSGSGSVAVQTQNFRGAC